MRPTSYHAAGELTKPVKKFLPDGGKIRRLRKKKNLSAQDVAKRINVSLKTVYKIESGESNCSTFTLEKLTNLLCRKREK